ncbi:hypothetical protein GN244_ATG14191 [Phytophthora infestans]|uniref:Uncharacterized protein n=1 Tax=Phytophthora infestans TaxID=4787 RepID=A0A833WQG9_PHYIN|nr:hypothetical protein GN244_ATG14191 [Phytophthora infestans]
MTMTRRVPHPIFAIVRPPKASSMARESRVEWLKLRTAYEGHIKDRCKDGKEDVASVMKSVKSSFDAHLLETLCKTHGITDSFQSQERPLIKQMFSNKLRLSMTKNAIDARVIGYFHSWGFGSEEGIKDKCKPTVRSLLKGPKARAQNELDCRISTAKKGNAYDLMSVKAKKQAIRERALAIAAWNGSDGSAIKAGEHYSPTGGEGIPARTSGPTGSPRDGCLHCGEGYYLSDCPTVTPAERDKLLADQNNKTGKQIRQKKQSLTEASQNVFPWACFLKQGRIVVLTNQVEAPLCNDRGADWYCLDKSCFR